MENFLFTMLLVEVGNGWLKVMDSSLDYELCKKHKGMENTGRRDMTYKTCKGLTN